MFLLKLIIVLGGTIFLSITFVRRLFLVLAQNKMQEKLERDEQRKKREELKNEEAEDKEVPEQPTKKIPKTDDIRKLFKKGETLFSRKEFDEAEQCFIKILAIDETHIDANLHLGLTYLKQENHSKAEFFFHKLVNLKKDPVYYSNLGLALYNQGRLFEAAEAYENALSMDDSRAARFANLAHVYRELSNDEKALANFEKASRKSPRNKDYLWALTEYYKKLGMDDELRVAAKRLLELDPYNKDVKKLLA